MTKPLKLLNTWLHFCFLVFLHSETGIRSERWLLRILSQCKIEKLPFMTLCHTFCAVFLRFTYQTAIYNTTLLAFGIVIATYLLLTSVAEVEGLGEKVHAAFPLLTLAPGIYSTYP